MSAGRLAGIVFIALGALGLAYGGFSFTREAHEARIGALELAVKDRETVNVPVWVGVVAIAVGGGLVLLGGRKSS